MNLEKSKIESIGDIIKNGSKDTKQLVLDITFYQRPYRWKTEMIDKLFSDYIENRAHAASDKDDKEKAKQYFLGAVVLVEKKDDQKQAEFEVVDGQQRLTTIYLMNYLKFCLLRCRIDEMIQFNPSNIKQEMEMMISCYNSFVGKKNASKMNTMKVKLYQIIDAHGAAAWDKKEIEKITKTYRKAVGLPAKKDLSDIETYYNECVVTNEKFLEKEKFCLDYSYEEYTESLREALKSIVIIYSNTMSPDWQLIPYDDEEEWPFANRAIDILAGLSDYQQKYEPSTNPEDVIRVYINLLDELINKLNVCEIITTKADDAYKLFETLNDRSEGVSDLELMKDYFYKYYVKKSGEGKRNINCKLKDLDKVWVESLNKYEKEERFWIAYCSTVYITGKTDIKKNDSLTKAIDAYLSDYCSNSKYSASDIESDFNVFKLVAETIHYVSGGSFKNIAFKTENAPKDSIVKRTLALLLQLDYKAIGAAIVCDILFNYEVNCHTLKYSDYLDEIFDEDICIKKHNTLWEEANVVWKTTILAEDYTFPKTFTDAIIQNRKKKNVGTVSTTAACVAITPTQQAELKKCFEEWASTWTYRKNVKEKQKIKLLFFHLMLKYSYVSSKTKTDAELTYNKTTAVTFPPAVLSQDLDHIEGETKHTGREKEFYKYDDKTRLNEINSIANMMILDRTNNVKKQNPPMVEGIDYYKKNCTPHWLINEIEKLFDANKTTNVHGFTVPKNDFFDKRTSRLLEYFYKIVSMSDSTHSNVPVSKL
ncbi:DUF262 domain-containing protein [Pseudobutyrivibrio sp. LB2011]|uniref:DUF262 domain-containing protein n=1 Tax=Pseudobutyrivibrio sp. LB2011 TaxID=1408312 RepID=UPI0005D20715|nr:DUF262 domain-containing protein [Pseudobutyrivibrio sp. LB2011]